ncbi:hypothetical protein GLOIN_2v1475812 [Rhizophagus clarus]|uniref:Uncharacterized protein n=1 Tax=Rhizophagus clarus TaxID=94130 RepID=A0A8H3R8H7_9GLOM|nr:hypothetical protein GLOIN_2v1475812 [Rhizophagus clarus]
MKLTMWIKYIPPTKIYNTNTLISLVITFADFGINRLDTCKLCHYVLENDPNFKEKETKDHIISLVEVVKQATSPFDDKRWILLDGMQTLLYKHWRIDAFYHYLSTGMTQENAE